MAPVGEGGQLDRRPRASAPSRRLSSSLSRRASAVVSRRPRRKLVIAGCTTDICLMFPAWSALAAGYDVYGVIDASGTWSELDQQIAVHRLVRAGVVVINTATVLTELQYNHRKPTDVGSGVLFADLVPQLAYTGALLRERAVPA